MIVLGAAIGSGSEPEKISGYDRVATQNFYRSRPEIFSNLVSIIWLSRFLMIFAFFHYGSRPDWVATQKKFGSRPELRSRPQKNPGRDPTWVATGSRVDRPGR